MVASKVDAERKGGRTIVAVLLKLTFTTRALLPPPLDLYPIDYLGMQLIGTNSWVETTTVFQFNGAVTVNVPYL